MVLPMNRRGTEIREDCTDVRISNLCYFRNLVGELIISDNKV